MKIQNVDFNLIFERFGEIENEISLYKNSVFNALYSFVSIENVIGTAIGWLSESLKMLGCTPSVPAVGIGRTHYEASSLLLKSIVYGNLDSQSDLENYVTQKLNETNIGPLGFGGKTTVLGSFVNVGNQRASGVRIVSVRPSCFVEPRVATLHL